MKDKLFLIWLHQRLKNKHNQNPDIDFMHKLRAVIHEYPEDKDSKKINPIQIKTDWNWGN